jgi:hypothetical protein
MTSMRSFSGLPGNAWKALTRSDNGAEQGLPLWLGVLVWVVLFAGLILLVFLLAH